MSLSDGEGVWNDVEVGGRRRICDTYIEHGGGGGGRVRKERKDVWTLVGVDISGLHSRGTTATLNDGGILVSHAIMTNTTKIFEERT